MNIKKATSPEEAAPKQKHVRSEFPGLFGRLGRWSGVEAVCAASKARQQDSGDCEGLDGVEKRTAMLGSFAAVPADHGTQQ